MSDVILHAFNWPFEKIFRNAAAIAEAGYGAVLFPPPLYSDEKGIEWWQRYQPKDYRVIRSHLGRKEQLAQAVRVLHEAGVRAYVDVVFNHMANEKGQREDCYNFPGETELKRYRDERQSFERDRLYGDLGVGLFSPWDFNQEGDIRNWNDPHESQEHRLSGLPDLDLNDWVIGQQQACLRALNDLGFDGYRIDAIKHLPFDHITRVFQIPEMDGKFMFGESLTSNDHEENTFLWPLLDRTSISYYDFPLHETLRRVFSPQGTMRELADPSRFGQALPWNRGVTFSITHDIPYNDGFRWHLLDPQDEFLANVYTLTRDGGVPLIFSDSNESAGKYPTDHSRWYEAWRRPDITAMIRFHNLVHGSGQRTLYENDGYIVFARGDRGIVALNKTADWQHPVIWTYGMRHGSYRCLIHGHEMLLSGEIFSFSIPPRQAQLWLHE